jgi:hypothetical protein
METRDDILAALSRKDVTDSIALLDDPSFQQEPDFRFLDEALMRHVTVHVLPPYSSYKTQALDLG